MSRKASLGTVGDVNKLCSNIYAFGGSTTAAQPVGKNDLCSGLLRNNSETMLLDGSSRTQLKMTI